MSIPLQKKVIEELKDESECCRCDAQQNPAPVTRNDDISVETDDDTHVFWNGDSALFSCSEGLCCSPFSKYGNLLKYLDIGKHSYSKHQECLSDRTKLLYKHKTHIQLVLLKFFTKDGL